MNVIRWQPPWPLIQISNNQWIIIRDQAARPSALVRYLENKPDTPYRVVRWAPNPADRRLFEYFRSLETADMAVTVIDGEPDTGRTVLSSDRSPDWEELRAVVLVSSPRSADPKITSQLGIHRTSRPTR